MRHSYFSVQQGLSQRSSEQQRQATTLEPVISTSTASPAIHNVFVQSDAMGEGEAGKNTAVLERTATSNSALIGLIVACSVFGFLTIIAMIAAAVSRIV